MSKRNATIAIALAIGILAMVPLADAHPRNHRRPGGAGLGFFGNLRHVQEEVNLSDAQVEQIRGIFTGLRSQNEAYRDQLRGGFHSVAETLLKNPNDLSAAQAMLDQRAAAQRAMKANRLAATAKALSVLTADQRAELAKMIDDRADRMRERRERRR